MIYLGIDYGLKHVGLSLADSPLASPLTQTTYQSEKQLFDFVTQVIYEQQVKAIVVGLPDGKLSGKVKDFGTRLNKLTNLPVYYQDETLSTFEAKQKLLQAHKPQKKRRLDHQAAATLILQNYLDDQPQS